MKVIASAYTGTAKSNVLTLVVEVVNDYLNEFHFTRTSHIPFSLTLVNDLT